MTNLPKVTVAIPVYNREKYIGEAMNSVLAQTFTDFELLVIDDGSTDRSRAIVQSYSDSRIRLYCNDTNEGIPKTRNRAVELARGEYLAFLDSDDWACPKRFAKQVTFLESHPECAAVGAWIEWMNAAGRPLGRFQRKPVLSNEIAAQRLFRQGITNSATMARTVVLREYGYREEYVVSEDFDLWSRITANHKLATLPEVLVRCRVHENRVTYEQSHRAKSMRLSIYAAQLRALGVPFTDIDLERHLLLRSMRKQKFTPDLDYLEWADAWLRELQAANQRTQGYPEPAFSELLGQFWLKSCWYASTNEGWRAWRCFGRSPLRRNAWQRVRKRLFWPVLSFRG